MYLHQQQQCQSQTVGRLADAICNSRRLWVLQSCTWDTAPLQSPRGLLAQDVPTPAATAVLSESNCRDVNLRQSSSLLLLVLQRHYGLLYLDSLLMICWRSKGSVCLQQQQQQQQQCQSQTAKGLVYVKARGDACGAEECGQLQNPPKHAAP